MPRFIPVTIYEQRTICTGRPPKFAGRPDAIQWAVAQGFGSIDETTQAYDDLCKTCAGVNVYPFWIRQVGRNLSGTKRAIRFLTTKGG